MLNANVAKVCCEGSGATVTLRDGRCFSARAAVVSVPIGVLQASVGGPCSAPGPAATPAAKEASKLATIAFEPPLPPDVTASIRRLGAGTLNKHVVEFNPTPEVLAALSAIKDYTFAKYVDDEEDGGEDDDEGEEGCCCAPAAGASSSGKRPPPSLSFPYIMNWTRIAGGRNPKLILFSGGSAAHRISAMPAAEAKVGMLSQCWCGVCCVSIHDRIVQALAIGQLRRMMPGLPPDGGVLRFEQTSWNTDPFALCSYSFLAVGSTPNDRRTLTKPVCDGSLWFTGEHTCVEHPQVVHGAYLAGERTARSVIKALSDDCD